MGQDTKISIPVRLTKENVGATRRKIAYSIHFADRRWDAWSREEAATLCVKDLEFRVKHAGVVVAYDACGQAWAASATSYQLWEVKRVAPDAAGCGLITAADARSLVDQISTWNKPADEAL